MIWKSSPLNEVHKVCSYVDNPLALLSHISEHKDNFGPFLVIAPSTTLFNWHNETLKFCPGLKSLPYWGSLKGRKYLRRYLQQHFLGKRESNFHVVITSYQIAVTDEKILQRLTWSYIILDEAQAIKNIKGQRWNTLLGLRSRNKLLLTGTPIQNTMAELWALLHFIMPKLFDSHEQFQEWFSKDIEAHSQNKQKLNQTQLDRLHAILKPFMLRRVKKDVEKEIGQKHEFEIMCKLTPRQQCLYEKVRSKICLSDFFALQENKEKAKNLMNLVMQFRKVCNHPDLFERKIVKSGFVFSRAAFEYEPPAYLTSPGVAKLLYDEYQNPLCARLPALLESFHFDCFQPNWLSFVTAPAYFRAFRWSGESALLLAFWTRPCLSSLAVLLTHWHYVRWFASQSGCPLQLRPPPRPFVSRTRKEVQRQLAFLRESEISLDSLYIEAVTAQPPRVVTTRKTLDLAARFWKAADVLTPKMEFPTFVSLILDSSKLSFLDGLLLRLKGENKRCLIFCQMTKMMDILEEFLQWRQYHYFRLDGSCNLSDRRDMVREYQRNQDVFVFLLSTRAGGLGVTLTAADVVIFYDNDWNPTMDAQAADRAHRIGRTKDVDVYRLITKDTIEDKIVKRAQQKKNVQQTVYSGETFKGNVFRANDILGILFDEKDVVRRKELKGRTALGGTRKSDKDNNAEGLKKEDLGEAKKHSGEMKKALPEMPEIDLGDFEVDFEKDLDRLLGGEFD